jgi:integrase
MTKLSLNYVHRFKDRHGHLRHYFRRPGYPRVALPGRPGSAEFMGAYQAALETQPLPIGANKIAPASLDALVHAYYASPEFRQLAPITQATYRNRLERLRAVHGSKPVVGLRREHVRAIMAAKLDTPAMANGLLKVLRILMRFALNEGWRQDDPTFRVRAFRSQSEGVVTWSEEDINDFEACHPPGSRARLALRLLLYTGQRKSDVVRMGRQHVRGGRIDVRQQKTGTRLSLPIHPALWTELDAIPADQLTFLITAEGRAFTAAGFGNWFSNCIREAGLPAGRSAHGLRKACARRLAEAGCTTHEIAAVTGHASLHEVERYTRAADQERLADTAMEALHTKQKRNEA